jgi:hypothetical protein
LDRGFHVYMLAADYAPWRYLWPKDVTAPQRLRDLAVLEQQRQRRPQFNLVLSRSDADAL